MYCGILDTKPVISEIHLGGGTPTFFSAENLNRLITGITQHAKLTTDADLSFEGHPANTTYDHLKALFNCGFRRLSLGIQDFDPAVQEIINRKQSFEQVERVCMEAREVGYTSINFDLIYGLPLQKLSSVENTIAKVIGLRPDRIAYYSYAHVPWIKPGQRSFTEADLPEDEEKRALYERGRNLLLHSGYFDVGMDHFSLNSDNLFKAAKSGHLHRNFMGYTHRYTKLSIGLGVSSISDSWYGFAQNTKSVETYLQDISDGRFPLIKGHILTSDDLVIRRYILDIMCKGITILNPKEPFYRDLICRLLPLEKDRLIVLRENILQVTNNGKAFLRNICMCFDQRLWEKKPLSQIFSTAV
jgi:oxygen-independent coproporphyrinogen-3 oxidase